MGLDGLGIIMKTVNKSVIFHNGKSNGYSIFTKPPLFRCQPCLITAHSVISVHPRLTCGFCFLGYLCVNLCAALEFERHPPVVMHTHLIDCSQP